MDSDCVGCDLSTSGDIDWNFGRDGSNPLVLPGRKKVKNKVSRKETKEPQKMSKSKQRKLRQLQEEKEKRLLLCQSIRTLQNNKIWDGAYSFMQSSGTIGQAETKKEKRRREVQITKAGVELLEEVSASKKNRNSGLKEQAFDNGLVDEHFEGDFNDNNPSLLKCRKAVLTNMNQLLINETSTNENFGGSDSISHEAVDTLKGKYDIKSKDDYSCALGERSVPSFSSERFKNEQGNDSLCMENCCLSLNFQHSSKAEELVVQETISSAIAVPVKRPLEVEEKRRDLPIIMMEQEIMEAIYEHSIVIICGETGSGKTTQVPQFLYEAGFGSKAYSDRKGTIGVTQPRRVAVLSTAKRVAYELGFHLGSEVGFQVRHDKLVGDNCSIKIMTDGILLREVQGDFLLKQYSVVILDEAHERSLNTDILIGLLSRIIKLRKQLHMEQQQQILSGVQISPANVVSPLKLVLMSATLRVEDFVQNVKLFHVAPPVIEIPVRQFPVTIHFSKTTKEDYLGQAYKKVMAIHKRLPPGGILVFVTGQREVEFLCKKLRHASQQLVRVQSNTDSGMQSCDIDDDTSKAFQIGDSLNDQETDGFTCDDDDYLSGSEPESFSTDSGSDTELDCEDELTEMPDGFGKSDNSLASLKAAFDALSGKQSPSAVQMEQDPGPSVEVSVGCSAKIAKPVGPLHVLPLYAMLPASSQLRIFEEVPEGARLVVVATNVAETSLTIQGIKYVVDTGKEKTKIYKYSSGVATYEVRWISKASASQRSGRAGRTGPGHCYRLYSAAAFGRDDIFPGFSSPEISSIPVDGVVLTMKFMGIDKVVNFPFPTSPKTEALVEAQQCLKALEALDTQGKMTAVGKAMAQYPMSPRHSRMLLTMIHFMKNQEGFARPNFILGYGVAVAAALSFANPFLMQYEAVDEDRHSIMGEELQRQKKKEEKSKFKEARLRFCNPSSDALTVANAIQLFELAEDPLAFCSNNSLHLKSMEEMSKLRKQLLQLIFHQSKSCPEYSWKHGSAEEVELSWRKHCNKEALFLNEEEVLRKAICAGWADRIAKRSRTVLQTTTSERRAVHQTMRYQSCSTNDDIFLHRLSSVSSTAPEFVVYTELVCTKRPYMHGVTAVRPDWLVQVAETLCTFSSPLVDPKPYYDPLADQVLCWVTPFFGRHSWELPLHSAPLQNDKTRVSVFAAALLEGRVLPCIRSAQKLLASPPSIALKPECWGQKRVGELLGRMNVPARVIDCRSKLREAWRRDPRFLYSEIQRWFQEKFYDQFGGFWEKMQQEVLEDGYQLFPKRAKRRAGKQIN